MVEETPSTVRYHTLFALMIISSRMMGNDEEPRSAASLARDIYCLTVKLLLATCSHTKVLRIRVNFGNVAKIVGSAKTKEC